MVFAGLAAGAAHPDALMDMLRHPGITEHMLAGGQFPWQQVRVREGSGPDRHPAVACSVWNHAPVAAAWASRVCVAAASHQLSLPWPIA